MNFHKKNSCEQLGEFHGCITNCRHEIPKGLNMNNHGCNPWKIQMAYHNHEVVELPSSLFNTFGVVVDFFTPTGCTRGYSYLIPSGFRSDNLLCTQFHPPTLFCKPFFLRNQSQSGGELTCIDRANRNRTCSLYTFDTRSISPASGGWGVEFYTLLITIFAICLLPITIHSQNNLQTLSLENLLEMAKQNSIISDAAKMDIEAAQLNYNIFKSGLKPQLSANANFPNFANTFAEAQQPDGTILFPRINNNNSALGLELNQVVAKTGGSVFVQSNLQRFDDFTNEKIFYNGTPFRVGFFQPLFGFNELKWNKKIEPMKLREAEKKYTADLENINIEAADLFFNLLVANENLQIANSNKESNETLLTIAEEKYKLGSISKRDLLQLQLELKSASKNKKQAEQSVRTASSAIYTFLGKNHQGEMITPIAPIVKTLVNVDLTIALQKGLANRFEQDSYERMLMEADRDIAQAKGESGLQADLFASFGLSRGGTNVGDIYSDPQQQQFVQLQLNVPILDWGAQKSRKTLATAQRDFLQKNILQNKLQLEANIQQTVDAFNNLQEQLQLNEEMKQLAQERFEITKESFVLGAISITELTLAQREKDQTAREYIFTLSQYWQNYFALRMMTLYDFQNEKKIN